jgi:hypothetical protein
MCISRQPNDHALSGPLDGGNGLSFGAPLKAIDAWLDRDWPAATGGTLNLDNTLTSDGSDPAAHRFDFWEFGHW